VVLEVRGAVKGGPFQLGAADLAALRQRTVRGADPASPASAEARWAGVDLAALLADHLELTGDADTVVFRTADGMAVPVPISVIGQLLPVLADRADGQPLPERVVAWPSAAQPGMASDPRAPGWWARRVTALELVSGPRVLGRALHVPEAAYPGARAGAAIFGQRCLPCHRVQGGGGERGPELTRVTDRLALAELRRKLEAHPGWHIPGQAEPSPQAAAQLDAFLRTVAAYDALPGDHPEGGEPASR
jgi:mono/diheme cytochrome c family protein